MSGIKGIEGGGGNSPNGVPGIPATPAGSGAGDNIRSYLYNAYPPSSSAEISSKQAILADAASGLGFYPDALIYGTPKGFIQPFYPLKPLVVPTVELVGSLGVAGTKIADISVSLPFRTKAIERLICDVNTTTSVCVPLVAKALAVVSDIEVVVGVNGSSLPPTRKATYFNFISGITSLSITTSTSQADVVVFLFM